MDLKFSKEVLNDNSLLSEITPIRNHFSFLLKELIILEICNSREEISSDDILYSFMEVISMSEAIPTRYKEEYEYGKVRASQMITNIVTSNAGNSNGLKYRSELEWRDHPSQKGSLLYRINPEFSKDLLRTNSIISKLHLQQKYPVFFNLESLCRTYSLPEGDYLTSYKGYCLNHGNNDQTIPIIYSTDLSELSFVYYCGSCILNIIDKEGLYGTGK